MTTQKETKYEEALSKLNIMLPQLVKAIAFENDIEHQFVEEFLTALNEYRLTRMQVPMQE